jgi:hypothetical protein
MVHMGERGMNGKMEYEFEAMVRKQWTIPYYKKNGYKGRIVECCHEYDIVLTKDNEEIKVEEKAERKNSLNMYFETIQDKKTNNLGWVYKCKADIIMYVFWNTEDNDAETVYKIKWPECKHFVLETIDEYEEKPPKEGKGWGETFGKLVPWRTLLKNNIAEIVYQKDYGF